MDKLVRKIEIPLAKKKIEKAGLYIATKKDLKLLSKLASEAYEGYPLHLWFTNGKYDKKSVELIMQISLMPMFKDGIIYADSDNFNGFAVWLPLGFTGSKTLPFLFNGGIKLIFRQGFGILKRLIDYEKYAMQLKKQYTQNVDWYLYNLTVLPFAQGKGLSRKLLQPMLDFCDSENMVAYLETNKGENVAIYNHFGFELVNSEILPKSDVYHYAMVRKPKNYD